MHDLLGMLLQHTRLPRTQNPESRSIISTKMSTYSVTQVVDT